MSRKALLKRVTQLFTFFGKETAFFKKASSHCSSSLFACWYFIKNELLLNLVKN